MQYQGMQFWAARRSDCSGRDPVVWGFHSGFCLQRLPSHCIITAFWKVHGPWIVFGERHVPLPSTIFPSSCAPASPFHISPDSSASQPVYPQLSSVFFSILSPVVPSLLTPGFLTHSRAGTSPWTLSLAVKGECLRSSVFRILRKWSITTRGSKTHKNIWS